jgi:hypothetical protein
VGGLSSSAGVGWIWLIWARVSDTSIGNQQVDWELPSPEWSQLSDLALFQVACPPGASPVLLQWEQQAFKRDWKHTSPLKV